MGRKAALSRLAPMLLASLALLLASGAGAQDTAPGAFDAATWETVQEATAPDVFDRAGMEVELQQAPLPTATEPATAEVAPAPPVVQPAPLAPPPVQQAKLPRKLPPRRGPTAQQRQANAENDARKTLRQALEGVKADAGDSSALLRRLAEVSAAAQDDKLPHAEREAGLAVVKQHLSAELHHHCHLDDTKPLRDFAKSLSIATREHVPMDPQHMAEVMQTFNVRLRSRLEQAIDARDHSQLEEVVATVQLIDFPRFWPVGDEGARQKEEYEAWSEEAGHALERAGERQDALDRLETAVHTPGFESHQRAMRHAEEVCDSEDLVQHRTALQEREGILAERLQKLEDALGAMDPERPPTEAEYYTLHDIFRDGPKWHMQMDAPELHHRARIALREALWRLGEG